MVVGIADLLLQHDHVLARAARRPRGTRGAGARSSGWSPRRRASSTSRRPRRWSAARTSTASPARATRWCSPPEEIGGELTENEKRTILVIANETVASSTPRRRAAPPRRTRASGGSRSPCPPRAATAGAPPSAGCRSRSRCWPRPASTPAARSWTATRSPRRRRPRGRGGPRGRRCATYPTGPARAGCDDDVVDRLRKATGLRVTRVVVRARGGARSRLARKGVTPRARPRQRRARRRRPGRRRSARAPTAGPVRRRSSLAPLGLAGPGWTRRGRGAAHRRRRRRVRRTIDALQAAGVQARGEVLDGDAAAAARIARVGRTDAPAEILLLPGPPAPTATEGALEAVAARPPAACRSSPSIIDAEAPAAPAGS